MFLKTSKEIPFYSFLIILALSRVLTSKILNCPADFDCNAYIKMAYSIGYDPEILGHHAMRLLPSYVAGLLHQAGLSLQAAFRFLSGSTYLLLGPLVYWVLRQYQASKWLSFSIALLCLAPHHAMRIPLQNVYQTCDIMVYPFTLLIIYFSMSSHRKKNIIVLSLGAIGILIKQNLFLLSVLSLVYLFYKEKKPRTLFYIILLTMFYSASQWYYQAASVIKHIIPDSPHFFSFHNILNIIHQAKLIELFIPILPFGFLYGKEIIRFLIRYWHVGLYLAIAIGQPIIGFHLTGNNFHRLALLGGWIFYFIVGYILVQEKHTKPFIVLFIIYSLSVYFTWGISQRWGLMILFSIVASFLYFRKNTDLLQYHQEIRTE